jgi:hypothetical protein
MGADSRIAALSLFLAQCGFDFEKTTNFGPRRHETAILLVVLIKIGWPVFTRTGALVLVPPQEENCLNGRAIPWYS